MLNKLSMTTELQHKGKQAQDDSRHLQSIVAG